MNIIAVDDEKLALDTLVDSIEKSVAEARVQAFGIPRKRGILFAKTSVKSPFWI